MITILVVYSDRTLKKSEIAKAKKYAFNTDAPLKVGDMIKSNSYNNAMQVVRLLDKCFKFYNGTTGKLSNEFDSTNQWEIRELIIREENDDVIYGQIIKD